MELERFASTDALNMQLDRILFGTEEDVPAMMRANSLDGLLTATGGTSLDDLLQDDFLWPRSDSAIEPLPALAVPLKPLRITREPVSIKPEPEDEYTHHHGVDQGGASWHASSPFRNNAAEEDGMSPSTARKRVRGSQASHLSDYDYTSSPTAAMRDLSMGSDQHINRKPDVAPGGFGDNSRGGMSPSGLQRRFKVRTMRELTASPPPTYSCCTSADESDTVLPRRACSTPRRAPRSSVASPGSSPLARHHGAAGDVRCQTRGMACLSSSGGASPSQCLPDDAEAHLDHNRAVPKNVNELLREAERLEQLNGVLQQQLSGLVEQIEQFQKENEVLRMVLAQVCRMRGDSPEAWNDLVARLREPSPMLSDNHAMQMAASALSASQGNALVALQQLLGTAMEKMRGTRDQ